jgi:hypothetical protein
MERAVEARMLIGADAEAVMRVLLSDAGEVLSTDAVLTVEIVGAVSAEHAVEVVVGEPRRRDISVIVPVAWYPVGHQRLLPSFVGDLEAESSVAGTRLRLRGRYHVPLGVVGQLGDGLAGRRLAQHTISNLLEELAARLDERSTEAHPTCDIDLTETTGSELYIG